MKLTKQALMALQTQVIDKVPEVLHADIWNEQIDMYREEYPFPPVAVFFEFTPIAWNTVGVGKTQHGLTTLKVRIVQNQISDSFVTNTGEAPTRSNALDRFTIPQKVHTALQRFRTAFFNCLERTGDTSDQNHDGIIIDVIEYAMTLIDNNDDILNNVYNIDTIVPEFELQPDETNTITPTVGKAVADFATFNSDQWLDGWFLEGGLSYSYRVISCSFNGNTIPVMQPASEFNNTDLRQVPVQIAPRDTIPAHNDLGSPPTGGLTYDHNWITFLRDQPIAEFLKFYPSPFHEFADGTSTGEAYYPTGLMHAVGSGMPSAQYGEGFQIEWPEESTFSIEVEYSYKDKNGDVVTGHTIEFTHLGYYIDGAWVPLANIKTFTE